MSEREGLMARLASRWRMTSDEIDDTELRAQTESRGCTTIADLKDRERSVVSGSVRSIIVRPKGDVPALVAELYDGTMALNLVWLGRHELIGVKPGVTLRATGRVTRSRGVLTIFNPTYEIVPPPSATPPPSA